MHTDLNDAELAASAIDAGLSGKRPLEEALADYERQRNEATMPMYELTCQLALLQPPPPEMQQLLGAIHGNQRAMDAFVQMNAGTISPAKFFAPENLAALMSPTVPV